MKILQEMDLKTFADDDFDPKKWINKAWSASGKQEKEVFVANAVSRLQLYMKQLTNSLDEATTQIVTSLPRIVQEATALEQEGVILQQKLFSLESKVHSVQEQTGHSIESLQKIDTLKSRLESAASTLQEADKWVASITSLENLLDEGVPAQASKLKKLAEQVAAMTQSLEVLCDAPDYERKRLQLETLYNKLEAAISPPLIDALTQMDSDRTSVYVTLFNGMGRQMCVYRCWRRAAAARLAAAWRRLDAHSVPALTRLLTADANKQIDWLANVLKSTTPVTELIKLYTDLLRSLEPLPTKVVTANLKLCATPEAAINYLIDLRHDIIKFVDGIRGIIEMPRPIKETFPQAIALEFGRAAYAPLREVLINYTDLQTQMFLDLLKDSELKQEEDLLEQSRAVLNLAERCDTWLTTAYGRAKKIAGLAAYPFYVPAVENMISALCTHISSHSRRIEAEFMSSVTAGQVTGVLSNTFPASKALETATAILLDLLAQRHKTEASEEGPTEIEVDPMEDVTALLLDADGREKLVSLRSEPPSCIASLQRVKEQLRTLARAILRHPVDAQLDKIAQLPVWKNNDALTTDLPDFALSPQEYITEIGQYLMTLPQHLEMHLSDRNAPWQFLSEVCIHTCDAYADKILTIRNMDELGTKRCITDIVYLSSVVEDLGTSITPSLKNLETSLRAATLNQTPAE